LYELTACDFAQRTLLDTFWFSAGTCPARIILNQLQIQRRILPIEPEPQHNGKYLPAA
jgi:hypothetical protein